MAAAFPCGLYLLLLLLPTRDHPQLPAPHFLCPRPGSLDVAWSPAPTLSLLPRPSTTQSFPSLLTFWPPFSPCGLPLAPIHSCLRQPVSAAGCGAEGTWASHRMPWPFEGSFRLRPQSQNGTLTPSEAISFVPPQPGGAHHIVVVSVAKAVRGGRSEMPGAAASELAGDQGLCSRHSRAGAGS